MKFKKGEGGFREVGEQAGAGAKKQEQKIPFFVYFVFLVCAPARAPVPATATATAAILLRLLLTADRRPHTTDGLRPYADFLPKLPGPALFENHQNALG